MNRPQLISFYAVSHGGPSKISTNHSTYWHLAQVSSFKLAALIASVLETEGVGHGEHQVMGLGIYYSGYTYV